MLVAIGLLLVTLLFVLYKFISYRLVHHPLAGFPGPKSVAATRWVEFYHDVVRGGKFIWEIEKMHQRYGMCFFPFQFASSSFMSNQLTTHLCRANHPRQSQ